MYQFINLRRKSISLYILIKKNSFQHVAKFAFINFIKICKRRLKIMKLFGKYLLKVYKLRNS